MQVAFAIYNIFGIIIYDECYSIFYKKNQPFTGCDIIYFKLNLSLKSKKHNSNTFIIISKI